MIKKRTPKKRIPKKRVRVPLDFISRGAVAKMLGVNITTVRYWHRTGKLPYAIDPDTGWWLSPVLAVMDLSEWHEKRDAKGSAPGMQSRRAYKMFAEGKLPRDVVLAIDGMTPERAIALYDLYRRDDPPRRSDVAKTPTKAREDAETKFPESEEVTQEEYDERMNVWNQEMDVIRRQAAESHERYERESREQAALLQASMDLLAAESEEPALDVDALDSNTTGSDAPEGDVLDSDAPEGVALDGNAFVEQLMARIRPKP